MLEEVEGFVELASRGRFVWVGVDDANDTAHLEKVGWPLAEKALSANA